MTFGHDLNSVMSNKENSFNIKKVHSDDKWGGGVGWRCEGVEQRIQLSTHLRINKSEAIERKAA